MKQMTAYNEEVGEQLIKRTASRSAGTVEKMFLVALNQLEVKSIELTDDYLVQEISEFSSVVDHDGDGGLFTSYRTEKAELIFTDGLPEEKRGVIVGDNGVELYTFAPSGQVVLGSVDVDKINLLIKPQGKFGEGIQHILFDSNSGSIIINSGLEDGFDGTAIGFLKNFEYARNYSSKDMFKDIHKGLSGYAVIKNNDGVNYAVCYEPVGKNGWYILQFIPEKLLTKNFGKYSAVFYIGAGVLVAITLIGLIWFVLASKRATKEKAKFSCDERILKMMVMQMAESSLASMFVYRRSTDEMDVLRDREVLYPHGKTVTGAIAYLEKYFGHTPEEIRRLKNALVLAVSKQYIRLELESKSCAGIQTAEYTLCAVTNENSDNGAEVVCTVVERPKLSESDIDSVSEDNVYNTTGIEVLLEQNSWRFMWNNEKCFEKLEFGTNIRSDYDNDLEQVISSFIMSKDRHFFMTALSRLNLLENYRNGNTEFSVKYRINTGGGVYEYRVLDIHMFRDENNDEIKANLFARQIG